MDTGKTAMCSAGVASSKLDALRAAHEKARNAGCGLKEV